MACCRGFPRNSAPESPHSNALETVMNGSPRDFPDNIASIDHPGRQDAVIYNCARHRFK
jgi:hypothetical protein